MTRTPSSGTSRRCAGTSGSSWTVTPGTGQKPRASSTRVAALRSAVEPFVDALAAQRPNLTLLGGIASAARTMGGNRLVLDGTVHDDGAVGVDAGTPGAALPRPLHLLEHRTHRVLHRDRVGMGRVEVGGAVEDATELLEVVGPEARIACRLPRHERSV